MLRKKVMGAIASLFGLTIWIDGVLYGHPDRTPRDPA